MFTIADIRNEYKRLDAITGQNIANIPIEISKRCTKRRGAYSFRLMYKQSVSNEKFIISDFVMAEDSNSFYNTIRHEYAHAIATRVTLTNAGHGEIWKRYAKMVGANPEMYSEKTPQQREKQMNAFKKNGYAVTCEKCGKQYMYSRKTKVINIIESNYQNATLTCPACGCTNHFKVEKL